MPTSASRNWRDSAACRNHDPELFFVTATAGGTHDTQVAGAKHVCWQECPTQTRAQCLADAVARGDDWGIYGGYTADERRALRPPRRGRRPADPPCGTPSGYTRHLRRRETTCDACRAAQRLRDDRARARVRRTAA